MRRIIFAMTIVLAAGVIVLAQEKTIKRVEVTTRTITAQPKGQHYVIDATRSGTVYAIDADVDLSRVQVRTTGGVTH